jgi:ABC-type transport system substrate-binding protein
MFTGSIWLLVGAYTVRFMAAALSAYDGGQTAIHTNMDAVARTLGHTPAGMLRRVHLPILRPSVLTALLIVFVDVMKELPATLIMRPFNFDTLAVQAHAETLRWARVGDALTLDPHSQNEGPTHTLNHHIYETLVGRALDGTLTPRLATEWSIIEEDDTVWVFKIREGVTFHEGQALTAEDVVFSLDRARTPPSGMAALHAAVEEVTAVDDTPCTSSCPVPAPLYVQNLTNTFIMSKAWAEANGVETAPNFAAGEEAIRCATPTAPAPTGWSRATPRCAPCCRSFEDHWDETPGR